MKIDLSQFRQTFFDEAAEHLASLEAGLLALEARPGDAELLNGVFRAAHSIKGGAATFGLEALGRFTHSLESLLDAIRDGRRALDPATASLLLRARDVLGALVAAAQRDATPPPEAEGVRAELDALLPAAAPAAPPPPERPAASNLRRQRVTFAPGPDLLHRGMDPLLLVRDLGELGRVLRVVPDPSKVPPLEALEPETCYLPFVVELETDRSDREIADVFAFVEDTSEVSVEAIEPGAAAPAPEASLAPPQVAAPAPSAPASPAAPQPPATLAPEAATLRVSTEKVDKLLNVVGELVIAHSMVREGLLDRSPSGALRALEAAEEVDRRLRELQERVMAVRMVPVASLFGRFSRVVRDLASVLGKEVELAVSGEDTELDKTVAERLVDPLTHLVRNAIDHGIEAPEERARAGKPARGRLSLSARHEGGSVVVEVADDGRGLALDRIRAKAVALGMLGADQTATDEELRQLVFAPGFSTAEKVSALSGRGVGLDVVKRNVEALHGTVALESAPGRGARFRVRLPLTLAILEGQLVRAGDETYIVPLTSIVESVRPAAGAIKPVLGRGAVLAFRGASVPVLALADVLGAERSGRPADATGRALVVVVESNHDRLGLLVDEVLGQTQAVVKSLETHYRRVPGVTGATILGDGRVALILDVAGLARLAAGPERGTRERDPGVATACA